MSNILNKKVGGGITVLSLCDGMSCGQIALDNRVCATLHINGHDILKRVYNPNYKSPTLTACRGGNTQKKVFDKSRCRKLTPNEYRKLQTIPDWYKTNVADSHIYNVCGDGWTIEVIKHLLKNIINDI